MRDVGDIMPEVLRRHDHQEGDEAQDEDRFHVFLPYYCQFNSALGAPRPDAGTEHDRCFLRPLPQ
jgi:hypothetical protein